MEQRISFIEGKNPFLIVAPAGHDDANTDRLTEMVASKLNGYAVINWGWERATQVDYLHKKADCNNTEHCQSVLYDEFLEPILKFKNRISKENKVVNQFIIQGISGNDFPPQIDMVVGAGSPNCPSCEDWRKKIFIYMALMEGLKTRLAKAGTILSGSLKKNLNQFFSNDPMVQSMQIEVPLDLRKNQENIDIYSDFLSKAIGHLLKISKIQAQSILPKDFQPKIY
jgi:hypothetical protein